MADYSGASIMVTDGRVDVGLGMRAPAELLDLGFVSLGEETVRVLADPDRLEKPGMELRTALDAIGDVLVGLSGYSR